MKKYLSTILVVSLLLIPGYVKADTTKVKIVELQPKVDTRFKFKADRNNSVTYYINYDLNKDGIEDLVLYSDNNGETSGETSVIYYGTKKGYSKDFNIVEGMVGGSKSPLPDAAFVEAVSRVGSSFSEKIDIVSRLFKDSFIWDPLENNEYFRNRMRFNFNFGPSSVWPEMFESSLGQILNCSDPLRAKSHDVPLNGAQVRVHPCGNGFASIKNAEGLYRDILNTNDGLGRTLGLQKVNAVTLLKLRAANNKFIFISGQARYSDPNVTPPTISFFYDLASGVAYKWGESTLFSELNDGTLLYAKDGKMFNLTLSTKQPVVKTIIWSICIDPKSKTGQKHKVKGSKCPKGEVKMAVVTE